MDSMQKSASFGSMKVSYKIQDRAAATTVSVSKGVKGEEQN